MPAYFRSTFDQFARTAPLEILGALSHGAGASGHTELLASQTGAWETEIQILRDALSFCCGVEASANSWGILLEYPIPRRQKRIDAVVLADSVIFVLEFKVGLTIPTAAAQLQVEDYALDLRDFHAQSAHRRIIPIVVGGDSSASQTLSIPFDSDWVQPVSPIGPAQLGAALLQGFGQREQVDINPINLQEWDFSAYRPVPTIIEAATELYLEHSVENITQAHADIYNLTRTTNRLIEIVQDAQANSKKIICFVTGVPGSGKTLAGLNAVHSPALRSNERPAGVFLSGNGPLVRIVSEALARNASKRKSTRITHERRRSQTFIQNVHNFIKHHVEELPNEIPYNRVVVFDEAQRAWDFEKSRKKFSRTESEPTTMFRIMDRHSDWAVIIALVGGGQEIYDGEAGLAEWGRSLCDRFSHWQIHISPVALHGGPALAGQSLFDSANLPASLIIYQDRDLDLPVSTRAKKAEDHARWVNALLRGDANEARGIALLQAEFPIYLTRSIAVLRERLGRATRGTRRCGLVASSGALRLRAHGIEVSTGFTNDYPYTDWFLADRSDFRSSFQLEVAATEFQCQGLELDWVGVCWGDDLTWSSSSYDWRYRVLRGNRWQTIAKQRNRTYLLNRYRVLLTRAREGIAIWVPQVAADDTTRDSKALDETAQYLLACGVRSLNGE